MKRVEIRRNKAPQEKVVEEKVIESDSGSVIEHVEDLIDDIGDVASDVVEIVEHVAPLVIETFQKFRSEPQEEILSKETLRISLPVPDVPQQVIMEEKKRDEEINTLELKEKILAHEECLLKIAPVAKKPITHILSANLVFNSVDFKISSLGVDHEIVQSDDPCSFMLFIKNNRNEDLNVKINYHVLFE